MNFNDIHRGIQKHKKRRRVGRGEGSGHGKTSTRGHKGQGSRAGYTSLPVFEGGQMPLVRRIPKRGFHNRFAETVAVVNLGLLNKHFEANEEVTPAAVRAKKLLKTGFDELKILGNGELTKVLRISAHRFSDSAKEKIQKAGGEAVVLPGKAPVVKNKQKQKTR